LEGLRTFTGSGGLKTIVDPNASSPKRYYRVVLPYEGGDGPGGDKGNYLPDDLPETPICWQIIADPCT
jgi:hypothetical protein